MSCKLKYESLPDSPTTPNRSGASGDNEAEIWIRAIDGLSAEANVALLQLRLSTQDVHPAHELTVRNQEQRLTASEQEELEGYCRVGRIFDGIHARARR